MFLQTALSVLISLYFSSGPVNFCSTCFQLQHTWFKAADWSSDLHALKQKHPVGGALSKTVAGDYSVVTKQEHISLHLPLKLQTRR